ncbi:hypothetical protein CHELA17_62796 [Chelatococcus asaccharovorans]|nr:hypothetical protein CHELA17_62796 [Chelatococcus asaccharovorans]
MTLSAAVVGAWVSLMGVLPQRESILQTI